MMIIYPPKLKQGDTIAVISPSRSFSILSPETQEIANKRLSDLGLQVRFLPHLKEKDEFNSSSIESRVNDLHQAFSDKTIHAIFTSIGGFNSNQLLRYLDWNLIQKNPKIFCGFSDITALQNVMLAKSGLVTYYGPHYSSFGQKSYMDYTLEYVSKCLFSDTPYDITPSAQWSDDAWYLDQDKRTLRTNPGWQIIHEGNAEGRIVGGNLSTFSLLFGTEYMPDLTDSIFFLEDDEESQAHHFDRMLQALIHQPGFSNVRGIVIGRFQNASKVTGELLQKIIETKKELQHIPVLAQLDFGHTDPKITFPIGGKALIEATSKPRITVLEH